MEWILSICIGVSALGCGAYHSTTYPSEEACYKALERMYTGDQPNAESSSKRNTVAYCKPAKREDL